MKIFLFYIGWLVCKEWLSYSFVFFSKVWNFFYHIFLTGVRSLTTFLLDVFGYAYVSSYRSVAVIGTPGVIIDNPCVGFGLTYAFLALIVSYPGKAGTKLWFFLAGSFVILSANALRIFFIVTSKKVELGVRPIEQHDLFNNLIYILIFIMWALWVKYINKPN